MKRASGLLLVAMFVAPVAHADVSDECIAANTKAQELRRGGHMRHARDNLILCAAAACPKLVRDDCAVRLDEVNRLIPTIVFQVKDPDGHDLTDVKVTMDGEALAEKMTGTAMDVAVGEHEFAFSADGFVTATQKYLLVEGQKDRRESVTLQRNAPPVVTPPPPPTVVTPPPPIVTPPPPTPYVAPVVVHVDPQVVAQRGAMRSTAATLIILGAVSFGGTIAFAVLGADQNSTIQAGGFATSSDIKSANDTGNAYNIGLGVTVGAGVLLLAIGVPLLLLNLGDGATTTTTTGFHLGAHGLAVTW